MSRAERLYTIERLLRERRAVPLGDFLQQLDVSRATFKRDMEYLRERLNAPIIWDVASRASAHVLIGGGKWINRGSRLTGSGRAMLGK